MGTIPMRVEGELFEAARETGATMSRSAAQQLQHWARIGRELESAPAVAHATVQRVLDGRAPYDSLPDTAQAVVRAAWDEESERLARSLNFAAEFSSEGSGWVEADEAGKVVDRARPSAG